MWLYVWWIELTMHSHSICFLLPIADPCTRYLPYLLYQVFVVCKVWRHHRHFLRAGPLSNRLQQVVNVMSEASHCRKRNAKWIDVPK